jgi:hypothetical protein
MIEKREQPSGVRLRPFLVLGVALIAVPLIAVAALLSPLFQPSAAGACASSVGLERAFVASDAVFVGTVTTVRDDAADGRPLRTASFAVERVWKGPRARHASVRVRVQRCGFVPSPGTRWLVFAGGVPLEAASMGASVRLGAARGSVDGSLGGFVQRYGPGAVPH